MIELTPNEYRVLKAIEDAGGEVRAFQWCSIFAKVTNYQGEAAAARLANPMLQRGLVGGIGWTKYGLTETGIAAMRAYEAKTP